jgi:ATP-binding cassette subfamily F protein uup
VREAASNVPKKLSYKERRELEELPARIEQIEHEIADLDARIGGVELYREPGAVIAATVERADAARAERDALYQRWDELESRS